MFYYRRHPSTTNASVTQAHNESVESQNESDKITETDVHESADKLADGHEREAVNVFKSVSNGSVEEGKGWGEILYEVIGQKCDHCQPNSYEMPLWYAEEAQKVITTRQLITIIL